MLTFTGTVVENFKNITEKRKYLGLKGCITFRNQRKQVLQFMIIHMEKGLQTAWSALTDIVSLELSIRYSSNTPWCCFRVSASCCAFEVLCFPKGWFCSLEQSRSSHKSAETCIDWSSLFGLSLTFSDLQHKVMTKSNFSWPSILGTGTQQPDQQYNTER